MKILFIAKEMNERAKRLMNILGNTEPCSSSKWEMVKSILKTDANCIFFHSFYGSPFLLLLLILAKLRKIKTVVKIDLAKRWLFGYSLSTKIKIGIARFLFTFEGLLADRLWATIDHGVSLPRETLGIPEEKFVVIPRSLPLEIGTAEKSNYILAVSGKWCDIKNLHEALEVFSEVSEEKEELEFWVVGSFVEGKTPVIDKNSIRIGEEESGREYRKRCEKKIEDLKISDKVKFLGPKYGEELRDIYRQAKIYYLPTKNDRGTSTLIEAMASGTPIVTRECPGIPKESIGNGICGFLENSKKGQKEAILRLLNDNELYEKMRENCLEKAESFTHDKISRKWEEFLSELKN